MKHLMNLINAATEIIMHLYLLHRLPNHLQIIIIDICIHQITLTLIEVRLRTYHLHLMHIRAMVPDMVVLHILLLGLLLGLIMSIPSLSLDHITWQGQCLLIR